MSKMKSHKAVLKRVRITASGKVKHSRAGKSHLNSGLTGDKNRRLRQRECAKRGDIKRLEKLLHRPLTPAGR